MTFTQIIRFIFVICFIMVLNVIRFNDDNLYYNAVCQLSDTEYGICKYLSECENTRNNLKNFNIQPKPCSFDKNESIVCCKIIDNNNNNQTDIKISIDNNTNINQNNSEIYDFDVRNDKRISQKKCKDLYDSEVRKVYGKRRTTTTTTRKTTTTTSTESNLPHHSTTTTREPPTTPIAGGKSVEYKQYPFMVAIGWLTTDKKYVEFKCGGSLIESNYIITAAHCIDIGGDEPKVIRTGGVNLYQNYLISGDHFISKIFVHPNYTKTQNYNDIAIIKISSHSSDNPACLYPKYEINEKYVFVKAVGYGQTQFAGPTSQSLLQIELIIIKNSDCKTDYPPDEKYPNSIINSQMCAFDLKRIQDTCAGDSGGPIFIEENYGQYKKVNYTYLVGLTSFGKYCAGVSPGVYTRISSYIDWIESIVWADEI